MPLRVLLLVVFFSFGCDTYKRQQPTPVEPVQPPPAKSPPESPQAADICQITRDLYSQSAKLEHQQEKTVDIERHHQRTIRKTCQGEIRSDRWETVKTPNKTFLLHIPYTEREMIGASLFNANNCQFYFANLPRGQMPIYGDGRYNFEIYANLSPGDFSSELRVDEGVNHLYLQVFYDCMQWRPNYRNGEGDSTCLNSQDWLLHHIPVKINYIHKRLKDPVTITESCP